MKETGMLLAASLAFSVIKNINRDEFFATISAALELKFLSDNTVRQPLRIETYEISGPSKVQLNVAVQQDGTMSSVHKLVSSAPDR
jgi:hypothetical protein